MGKSDRHDRDVRYGREQGTPTGKNGRKPGAVALPVRRYSDQVHSGQLLWSFAVAFGLVLAAYLQWTTPKNALLEQDRAPAQIRLELPEREAR